MRRLSLLVSLLIIAFAFAAPTGAVFASDGEEGGGIASSGDGSGDLAVPPLDPPVVVPPEDPLPDSPILITAYKATGAHLHAVQLYNNSSDLVPLKDSSLFYVAGDAEYLVPLPDGWIEPRSYMVLAWQGESEFSDAEFMFDSPSSDVIELIELKIDGYQKLQVAVPAGYGGELMHRYKSEAGNYTSKTTFSVGAETISGGGLYVLPGMPDLSVRELLIKPRSCVIGVETPDCYDYIKVRNVGVVPINLGLYRLRSGFSNVNSTASNTAYLTGILPPGETRTITQDLSGQPLSFAANDGTVWLEDIYGFEAYDLEVAPYVDSNLAAQTGRSWAFNDEIGQWQWATPSPFAVENNFTVAEAAKGAAEEKSDQLVPCKEGQYRSEETNRCRNIAVARTLKPCKEGQYRSEETNRCRSIATAAASVLKPCADGQFRNPATNRCKAIASTDDVALADCGEGRERNPETNRCRNVISSVLGDTVPFPVEKIEPATESFVGWWAIGVLAAIGAGYGLWEWRYELVGFGRRAAQFISRSK